MDIYVTAAASGKAAALIGGLLAETDLHYRNRGRLSRDFGAYHYLRGMHYGEIFVNLIKSGDGKATTMPGKTWTSGGDPCGTQGERRRIREAKLQGRQFRCVTKLEAPGSV